MARERFPVKGMLITVAHGRPAILITKAHQPPGTLRDGVQWTCAKISWRARAVPHESHLALGLHFDIRADGGWLFELNGHELHDHIPSEHPAAGPVRRGSGCDHAGCAAVQNR